MIIMNKVLWGLSIFLIGIYSNSLFAAKTIRITNGEWEPYLSEYSYEYGLASHIVSEAFKLEGIKVVWGFRPWVRAYDDAKKGEHWDASAVWWPTQDAKESFLISDPVINTSFVFFHLKKKNFHWQTFRDLKGLRIGTTRSYEYGNDFKNAIKEGLFKNEDVTTDEQNFQKLLKDRIDVFPNDPIVGAAQLRNSLLPEQAARITFNAKEFEKSTGHLIISKKCKNASEFLKKFNSGLRKLKESGRLDQMFKDLAAGKYDKKKSIWKPSEEASPK